MDASGSVRVDSWIWAVRALKTRSLATATCRAGHVRVNGDRAKPAAPVRVGDEVRVRTPAGDRILIVRRMMTKRTSAAIAATCYEDRTPPPPPAAESVPAAARERGAGRPTKRERRAIDRLRGR